MQDHDMAPPEGKVGAGCHKVANSPWPTF